MMAKKPAAPEPSTPTAQSGPAQGADPAVVIARPADEASMETDAGVLKQLSEDNGAGPRQEPVHRQTAPVAEVQTDDDGQPVPPPKPAKHGPTEDADVEELADAMIRAMETQSVVTGGDGFGREYEFYTTTMNNQSVVMCVIKRGFDAMQIPVSTAMLHIEDGRKTATDTIRALDGLLV